ncbi:TPMT family class I SAM-dependent methyltransferase [bacterium]|nr:TPMT family class I SAM-dependent methyltransferase [bacterium]
MKREFWEGTWERDELPWSFPGADGLYEKGMRWLGDWLYKERREVLVPLCGDSPVVRSFYDHGCRVVGVDFVPEALERLRHGHFAELSLSFNEEQDRWTGDRVELVQGDFFSFALQEERSFNFIYDRAALVAIQPERRAEYAALLEQLLMPGGYLLLEFFSVDSFIGTSAPFGMPHSLIAALFPKCRRTCFSTVPRQIGEGHFRPSGQDFVERNWCLLQKR